MDKIFSRNSLIFIFILLSSVGLLLFVMVSGDEELEKTDQLVEKTHSVILQAEQLPSYIEGMLSAQRGYLLTGDKSFLDSYNSRKAKISENVARLTELTADNPSQQSLLGELRNYVTDFAQKLEERAAEYVDSEAPKTVLSDVEKVDNLRDNIIRLNQSILFEEHSLLNERVAFLEDKKAKYSSSLIISVIVGAALLLILNIFLLSAQRKRSAAESDLEEAETRFKLAVEGLEDGVFDWDIRTGEIFYTAQFFGMLNYDRIAKKGTLEDMLDLVHPDDKSRVTEYMDHYLGGELSEYDQEFRLKDANGRWKWVRSRAKALFDDKGKPYRIVGAHSDITALKRTAEKLETEKTEAVEANKAKSDFLAHMSHEIRTPLTAISGIAEILERKQENLTDKQKRLIETLRNSTDGLKDLVNDVLDFSKIESREIDLEEEYFALDAMIENIISMMALKASEKGISFVFSYEDVKDTKFLGDKLRLRQILINLINNAIKFTEKGGVTVSAYEEDRQGCPFLRIDVADTGIGIDPENFDRVFDKFKQVDASVSRKYGGTGLGLPISKSLAELMGGDIFISSQMGKGSTFSLLLPIKKTDMQDAPIDDRTQQVMELDERLRTALNDNTRLLIAEDYEGNVVMLSFMLEDLNIDFDVANTGQEAVNLWSENHYDAVLMDIQMPEMDGFTATKEIRQLEQKKKKPRTPIIGMTAHALAGDRSKCLAAGMDSYLPKPLVEVDLKKEILKFVSDKKKAA